MTPPAGGAAMTEDRDERDASSGSPTTRRVLPQLTARTAGGAGVDNENEVAGGGFAVPASGAPGERPDGPSHLVPTIGRWPTPRSSTSSSPSTTRPSTPAGGWRSSS